MILRREFFKKVFIGSIFALQFTVICPVYNVLAVGPTTDKTAAEDSIPSDIDKKTEEVEKVVSEKDKVDEEAEKAKRDEDTEKAKRDEEAKKAKRAEAHKKANKDTKSKLTEITKDKEEPEKKDYNDLIKNYYHEIDVKYEEIERNIEKLKKINLNLKTDNITEEEKQALQDKFNKIDKYNQRILNKTSEIVEKLEKVVSVKNKLARKSERTNIAVEAEETIQTGETVEAVKFEEDKKVKRAKRDLETNWTLWKLYPFKNENDLTIRILNDPYFTRNWANIAGKLGFAWCHGTKSQYVGEDFSIKKTGDNEYTLSANYNPTGRYARGHAANQRLKIKVDNIKFYIDEDSIEYGEKRILSLKPVTVAAGTFINEDDKKPAEGELNVIYTKTTTVTRKDNFNFKQQIGTETKFTVGMPGIATNENTVSMTLDFGQGWSDTKSNSTTKSYAKKITTEIDPRHKRKVELVAAEEVAEVPYKAKIYMSYHITLDGFLRWSGNAHVDHPRNRPYCKATFGDSSKGQNAVEVIKDIYDNKYISGYSQWDFNWVDEHYAEPYTIKDYIDILSINRLGGIIEGVFECVDGTEGELIARDQVPLSTPDDNVEENLQHSVVFERIE